MRKVVKVFKGSNEGFRVQVGAFYLRWFIGKGVRFQINFSSPFWIDLFGFNQKNFGI